MPVREVALWPFEGRLDSLLQPGRCVITETYPAEACVQLGLPAPGNGWSKARQADRIAKGAVVAERLQEYDVMISRTARCALENGFGPGTDGEDQFDSFVGLAAMLGVLLGFRSEGFPADPAVQSVEGWILGQGPLQVAVNGRRDS